MKLVLILGAAAAFAAPGALENTRYRIRLDGTAVEISLSGKSARRFEPRFIVLRSLADPKFALRLGEFPGRKIPYNVSTWQIAASGKETAVAAGHVADGFNPLVDRAAGADRTADAFAAAPGVAVAADKASLNGRAVEWTFAPQPGFDLAATIHLDRGAAEPRLVFTFTPKRDGFYSVVYAGAPASDPARIDEMWQPLIWQEKRFPDRPYLTESFRCPIPGTLVAEGGVTTGVVADPAELPFQPMPTAQNTGFGVAVRNPGGQAQSTLFAPILGGSRSRMSAGQPFRFALRLVVNPAGIFDTYRHIARTLFGVRDYRRNHAVSLNRTFENMVDYAMGPYARFNSELRGSAYDTDVPGSVKNISALHPLSVALVTDSEAIYAERARPMIEYGLSREKFLFSNDPNVKGQGTSSKLTGPGVPVSEVAALYSMLHGRSPFLLDKAKELLTRKRVLNLDDELDSRWWGNLLALYRATGEKSWLDRARAGADAYVAQRVVRRQTDFEDPHSRGMFFWPSYVPQWAELYELWQETKEPRYLQAALDGARRNTEFMWMCPRIPDGEVLVNQGGRAPSYRSGPKYPGILIPEERVPAWRVSEIGLTPESAGTSKGHRGILLACYAPYFLRLAREANDDFLHDLGRAAVVGRYTTFPGYHMNTARTTVYEKPDFPMRPMMELNSTSSLHYNHIWAQVAMVLDYLVSDVAAKSAGQVDFPSQYAEGYAYVTSKVYGDRPGRFYDGRNVWLWMPKGLLTAGDVQVNWLAARGSGNLYLAFANQSPDAVNTTVRLDPALVPAAGTRTARVWKQNRPAGTVAVQDGAFPIALAPSGITAVAIQGLAVQPKFQPKVLGLPPGDVWRKDAAKLAFGGAQAMLLNPGPGLRTVYLYLEATSNDLRSVTLQYSTGGEWRDVTDSSYPFEFTVPLAPADTRFRFRFAAVKKDGSAAASEEGLLER